MRIPRAELIAGVLVSGVLLLGAKAGPDQPPPPSGGPQEAEVTGVLLDPLSRQPVIVLQGKRDKRQFVMTIGHFEANGIALPLQGLTPPRPLTHDLMLTLLNDLQATVRQIVITDLKDDVYYAVLHLEVRGSPLLVDSRPSDAIALALRARAPILVEDRVFDKAERRMPQRGPTPHF
jgi:uncharacterized protein